MRTAEHVGFVLGAAIIIAAFAGLLLAEDDPPDIAEDPAYESLWELRGRQFTKGVLAELRDQGYLEEKDK